MIIKGGFTNYGEAIGILMLNTRFARPVGDVGNALTFSFPVKYRIIQGASPQRVVKEADPSLLEPFISAAKELEKEGVKAITTSCGFLAMFQQEMAAAVNVPLFTSSLIQIPFVYKLLGDRGKIGILTARKASLTERHFRGVGAEGVPLAVAGMDNAEEFTKVYMNFSGIYNDENTSLDFEKCKKEMQEQAKKLVEENPEIRAIVMECTNMPPFNKAVQDVTHRPVFDIVTLTKYIYLGVEGLL